jgi:hypothetical protein
MTEAEQEREEGIRRVEKPNAGWIEEVVRYAVRPVAKLREEFTTDAVRWYVENRLDLPLPTDWRALGPVMRRAARLGICEPTGCWSESCRGKCHARPLMIWRSNLR